MKHISRRLFLYTSFLGLSTAKRLPAMAQDDAARPLGQPPGCQIYGVRKQLAEDFDKTLKVLFAAGYRLLEFCSPPGYANDLAPLVSMSAKTMRQKIDDAGLRVVSCHYQFDELKENGDERIAFAKELGLEHMIVASVGRPKSLDAWLKTADELNQLGEKVQKAGMQLGFHNHTQEFETMDGKLVFDELMKRIDPKLANFQFHLTSPSSGFKPIDILTKYHGRFLSLHIMDWAASGNDRAPVGQGLIDWKKLFAAAKQSNVKYYFVEMDMDALKASGAYLCSLKV
ncbi:MAG: sugar phosphate isomerase/epimerase [Candidatus Omnitrophota bacterium]